MLPFHEAETCPCDECKQQRDEREKREDRAVFLGLLGIAFLFAGLLLFVVKAS